MVQFMVVVLLAGFVKGFLVGVVVSDIMAHSRGVCLMDNWIGAVTKLAFGRKHFRKEP